MPLRCLSFEAILNASIFTCENPLQNPPPRDCRNRAAGQHFRRGVSGVGEQERDRGSRHKDQKTRVELTRLSLRLS